jgi:hypothetical protein
MNYEPLTYFQFRKRFPYLNYLDYSKYLEDYDKEYKKFYNLKSD